MEPDNEQSYKMKIKENLYNTIDSGYIPELGYHKAGKVRHVHFTSEKVGAPIVMVASDRVSSFDFILDRSIPYKGYVLNLLSNWAFDNTQDIIPNATLDSPHPYVFVQKNCKNVMIECVVRGYVWGSLAGEYESGKRSLCGVSLPEGLLRYQKLDAPMFTPTTKSEHDEPMTYEEIEQQLGVSMAAKLKKTAIALFERAGELAEKAGLIFIDTKYEFGVDETGELRLIDEANTPDSSRYCSISEYRKYADIKTEMAGGRYKDVSALLKAKPELKIKEMSKQFVRDVLVENGFSYGSTGEPPSLTDDVVVEVSYRYIRLYEILTGKKFPFPSSNPGTDLLDKLQKAGFIKGGMAVIMAGSDSDAPHITKIKDELAKFGIPTQVRICSAHKQPAACERIVAEYNKSLEPLVFVAVAGGTDALSGVLSFHSVHPVISCPPSDKHHKTCLANPPGSSNSLILKPSNVARHVAQILGHHNREVRGTLLSKNASKIKKLEDADGAY